MRIPKKGEVWEVEPAGRGKYSTVTILGEGDGIDTHAVFNHFNGKRYKSFSVIGGFYEFNPVDFTLENE